MSVKFKKEVIDKALQLSKRDISGRVLEPEDKIYFLAKSIDYFRDAVVGVDMDEFLDTPDDKIFTPEELEAARTYDILMDAEIEAWDEVVGSKDINELDAVFYEKLCKRDIELV